MVERHRANPDLDFIVARRRRVFYIDDSQVAFGKISQCSHGLVLSR
jgi:hypothetical protein